MYKNAQYGDWNREPTKAVLGRSSQGGCQGQECLLK